MADTKFKVTIITPDGTVYDNDNATMVIMNTSGGQMGIMAKHVPVLASLTISSYELNMIKAPMKLPLLTVESCNLMEKLP